MVALLLVLLAGMPPLGAEAARTSEARWFGPTGMLEGWHVRVAFAVTNPLDTDLIDATVGRDVPFAEELLAAQWASSRKGGTPKLESFELDERSVRVVEYRNVEEGAPTAPLLVGEVPSRASFGLFEKSRPYNNKTQPDVHVQWVVPGVFKAKETRFFYVYADTKTNGLKDAPPYTEAQMGPLDGRHWISRGTVLYGVASRVTVIGLEDGTLAQVETYQSGKPELLSTGDGNAVQNPMTLQRGTIRDIELSDVPQLLRVVSNKPVIALGTPRNADQLGGPVPSADGGLFGTRFYMPPYGPGYVVLSPDRAATVFTDGMGPYRVEAPGILGVGTVDYDTRAHLRDSHTLTSDVPVMVLAWPAALGLTQMPTNWGAPVGSRIEGLPYAGRECLSAPPSGRAPRDCVKTPMPPCTTAVLEQENGQLVVTTYDERAWLRGRDLLTGALDLPRTTSGILTATSQLLKRGEAWKTGVESHDCPKLLHTTPAADDDKIQAGARIAAYGGGGGGLAGPLGGPNATQFFAHWPVTVVAFHNATEVQVRAPGKNPLVKGLGASDYLPVEGGTFAAPVEIRASKPVAVLSRVPGGYFTGLDTSLQVARIGAPEYRGYLVSLEPAAGATEPMLGVASAGKTAKYEMVVRNLAKDDRGQWVRDSVRLSVDPPAGGWGAELSETSLDLAGGESRTVTLTLTPPDDVEEGAPLRVSVHATSQGNPQMADHLGVVTVVRAEYDVDAWFDREGGPKARTLTIDPGATQKVQVVVKNLAALPDRLSLQATPLSSDWTASFEESSIDLLEVDLPPGESRPVTLIVTAPVGNGSQSIVNVLASSVGDSARAAQVSATVRVRADVRIALEAPNATVETAPGETARLNVTFLNRGSDRVSIRFNATGLVPPGWGPVTTRQGGFVLDELSGIAPGEALALEVEVPVPAGALHGQRAALQFFVETIPQFVGDPVLRESTDLLVLAAQRHRLLPEEAPGVLVADEDGQVRARLQVENSGNGAENLTVVPIEVPRDFSVLLGPTASIPIGGRLPLAMTLRAAPQTPAGTYPVVAEVRTSDGHTIPWAFNVTLPERASARLTPLGPARGIAGVEERARVEVANEGNLPLDLPPRLALPDGWTQRWEGGDGFLAPGASAALTLSLRAPADTASGQHVLSHDPAWATGPGMEWDLRSVALGLQLVNSGREVEVLVTNGGDGDAFDVDVQLQREGRVVDRVVLQRVPAGESTAAILLPREDVDDELLVVVDNASRYSERPLEVTVPATGGRSVPAVGPAVALLGLAALALLLGRRR